MLGLTSWPLGTFFRNGQRLPKDCPFQLEATRVSSLPLDTEFIIKWLSLFHLQMGWLPIYKALSFYFPTQKVRVALKCSWAVLCSSVLLRMILVGPSDGTHPLSLYHLSPPPWSQSLATVRFPRIAPTVFYKYFEGSFSGFPLNYSPSCILERKKSWAYRECGGRAKLEEERAPETPVGVQHTGTWTPPPQGPPLSLRRREGHFQEGERPGIQEKGNGAPPQGLGASALVSPKNQVRGQSAGSERPLREWAGGAGVRQACHVSLAVRVTPLHLYIPHTGPRELDGKSELFLLMISNFLSIEISCC